MLADNAGLYDALKSRIPVKPIFMFDKQILDKLENLKIQGVPLFTIQFKN